MADKSNKPSTNMLVKPVPMKLFAAWEVDRTPSNCIPRLCTLTLTRLVLLKPLSGEVNSIIISVKMQSSKRTLRSNEIIIPNNGLLDTELDLTFSLQYPHFLKRNGNNLQIMIQRRKKYKNRAILGFKTVAGGVINMAQVLQKPLDKELELGSNVKEKSEILARVTMLALSSQPVDHYDIVRRKRISGRPPAEYSDDEEDYSSNEEGCDSEPGANHMPFRQRKSGPKLFRSNGEERPDPSERNIKQKFIALLRRFRIPDTEVSDSEQYQEELEQDPQEIEALFEELEELTDSAPEVDDVSISSTPKPSLRPFFSSGTLTLSDKIRGACGDKKSDENIKKDHEGTWPHQDELSYSSPGPQESVTDPELIDNLPQQPNSPPRSEEKKQPLGHTLSSSDKKKLFNREKSTNSGKEKRSPSIKDSKEKSDKNNSKDSESSPKKAVLEQLSRMQDEWVPERLILVGKEGGGLARELQERGEQWVVPAASLSDVRSAFQSLVNKLQKFCNCNSRTPPTIRLGVLGHESFVNGVLRLYVEHFSTKPPEWQAFVRFYIVPLSGISSLVKYLGRIDSTYGALFVEGGWKELVYERLGDNEEVLATVTSRVITYLTTASTSLQMPISEAMVTYRGKSSEDESTQVFIPFITDVKIGSWDGTAATSVDLDESLIIPSGNSPPDRASPPSSPSLSTVPPMGETLDLQIDYWKSAEKKSDNSKFSLKTTFRTLYISRLDAVGSNSLTFNYVTKEKKQKIMRLGKKREKEKEIETRYQTADGINRLICSCKNPPMKVIIDGVEWSGVKFFQLTSQWQTHVKNFPIATFVDQYA